MTYMWMENGNATRAFRFADTWNRNWMTRDSSYTCINFIVKFYFKEKLF